jgi:hypothetical protein
MHDQQSKQVSDLQHLTEETLQSVSGGIWDYSNRLGPILGQMLEDKKDHFYGNPLTPPKNLDEAAAQGLKGWVSVR